MGQEFIIKSTALEDKINQLLPSQGGQQPGVDLSASTTIIPIVDLTETAEGSDVRQDLQTALSLNDITDFQIQGTFSTVLANTPGYYRVFGTFCGVNPSSSNYQAFFDVTDGTTTKNLVIFIANTSSTAVNMVQAFDFVVFLAAGQTLRGSSTNSLVALTGCAKQIADINGNLTTPS